MHFCGFGGGHGVFDPKSLFRQNFKNFKFFIQDFGEVNGPEPSDNSQILYKFYYTIY